MPTGYGRRFTNDLIQPTQAVLPVSLTSESLLPQHAGDIYAVQDGEAGLATVTYSAAIIAGVANKYIRIMRYHISWFNTANGTIRIGWNNPHTAFVFKHFYLAGAAYGFACLDFFPAGVSAPAVNNGLYLFNQSLQTLYYMIVVQYSLEVSP